MIRTNRGSLSQVQRLNQFRFFNTHSSSGKDSRFSTCEQQFDSAMRDKGRLRRPPWFSDDSILTIVRLSIWADRLNGNAALIGYILESVFVGSTPTQSANGQ